MAIEPDREKRASEVRRGTRWVQRNFIPVVLAILSIFQLASWLRADGLPLAADLRAVRGLTKIERSLRLSFGADFAEYLLFLRGVIPTDGVIVLPPVEDEPVLGHTGLMQYFLFPRRTTNCPSSLPMDSCPGLAEGARTYLLKAGEFPPSEADLAAREYLRFDSRRGLYSPPTASGLE